MPNIDDTLNKLREFDLSTYPYMQVEELIRDFGKVGYIKFTLHPNKVITRARLNEKDNDGNFKEFSYKCDLTYPPAKIINNCQRANLPKHTMFYGTIIPEDTSLEYTRIIAACESSRLLYEGSDKKGIESITYGRWSVKKDINLIAIVQSEKYNNVEDENLLLNELKENFEKFNTQNPDNEYNTSTISTFIANEFSKDIQGNSEYEYFISALFTKIVSENEDIHGVLYPSVKTEGKFGFCVAIKPEIADQNLILEVVGESKIYKNGEKSFINVEKIAKLYEDQIHFHLSENPHSIPLNVILEKIDATNLDELV